MDLCTTLILLGLVLVLFMLLRWRNKPHNLPPGPSPLPIVGNILTMDLRAPFQTFLKWSKTYGPVMTVYLGTQRVLVLVGYDAVKEALIDNADDFVGRAPVPFAQKVMKGYGINISNGERWRQLRRFTLTTLRDFGMGCRRMEGWIQDESRHLLNAIKETKSALFDPTFFLSRAVSNIICALVFGQRFIYEDHHFLRLLQVINGILQFGSSTWEQLYDIFPRVVDPLPGKHHDIFKEVEEIKVFSKSKIEEHADNLDPDNPRDFIDCFLIRLRQEKDNPNSEFHHENLIASVLNLFLAGTETTSTTLRYALMLLIKHPEIQDRMQKEIDIVIGRERSPNMEDRKSLPFTDAVIHEAQRYIDLIPLNVPHYTTHHITFRGYTIPKDTVILPLLHSVLRDKEHWEKPWTFDPKHFMDKKGNFKKNPAFMPFSAGKRACVGESLARMELFLFLVSLLQHFTFTTPGGPESIDSTPEIRVFANLPRKYQLIATPR